ncbi:NAD-dependent epimerase/dehydratase family protein [Paenibacillus sp. CGMCC 1.16610]|uniref:NAD-dependent epimerase/dehydratase family protein n=1 Tax=Paenibacillus anseongense TaxID=2682845 RepID=A0ABW9UH29_9BACL|nr:NAD-dependent epimerase/dehydratase family protein [Paenibacillus sp. CGMCC 1.16610]MBA2942654.1 NAD-dependent epimerase/dehydratase family protein [Paenibacillus sp. CGMCC 1.16610]MVQ38483.1 NAD-dependent epimerase/dehydratase family protein [Paenibacillus anseongense]
MNILVTGGAGFIGSQIVDDLLQEGHDVHIFDNLTTGRMAYVNAKAVFHHGDLLDGKRLAEVFAASRPEVVIHHAAQIDVQTSLIDPLLDAKINILGTIDLLEQCREHGVRKLTYASSAAVYGTPQYLSVDEAHPVRPLSFYGISKHTPEHYIESFALLYGMDYTILRYANVYGIRQDPKGEGGVVAIFMDKLLDGKQPIIYGDGEQTRDFIYVQDVVSANRAALYKGSRGIYNISCNEQTSVNELLKEMCSICGSSFNPAYKAARTGDIVHSRLDNRAALNDLGWSPIFTLRDGLGATFAYYKTQYQV